LQCGPAISVDSNNNTIRSIGCANDHATSLKKEHRLQVWACLKASCGYVCRWLKNFHSPPASVVTPYYCLDRLINLRRGALHKIGLQPNLIDPDILSVPEGRLACLDTRLSIASCEINQDLERPANVHNVWRTPHQYQ
jgi:hypothetical protein